MAVSPALRIDYLIRTPKVEKVEFTANTGLLSNQGEKSINFYYK